MQRGMKSKNIKIGIPLALLNQAVSAQDSPIFQAQPKTETPVKLFAPFTFDKINTL